MSCEDGSGLELSRVGLMGGGLSGSGDTPPRLDSRPDDGLVLADLERAEKASS